MVRRALLIALLLGSTACVTTKPLAPADRDVAVTIDDLQHWVTRAELSTTEEHLERKDQLGNSFLSYRYEGHHDDTPLIFNTEAVFATDEQIAKSAFRSFRIGSKLARGEVEESASQIDWGEQSSGGHLLVDGEVRGHVFVGRRGTVVILAALGGLYHDDPGAFERLLEPHLWRLSRHDPDGGTVASRSLEAP